MTFTEQDHPDQRQEELAQRLDAVQQRIQKATVAAGRDQAPELIVVTKYFPAADVQRLYRLGIRQVGENKDQEASAKAAETLQLEDLRWHFVGQLQRNKAKSVVRYATTVHSLDRPRLVTALDNAMQTALAAGEREQQLEVLLQIDLQRDAERAADAPARGGVTQDQLMPLIAAVEESANLQLRGLMAVAPLDEPAEAAFARLAELSAEVKRQVPGATWLSAGMSQDLEQAVAHGATHLRIGRDVLGQRPAAG